MGALLRLFRKECGGKGKGAVNEGSFNVSYPTGYLALDFLNGCMVKVPGGGSYYSVGLVDGSAVTLIGRSGCGKSTFALDAAANIIRPFPNGLIFYDDIEAGSDPTRRIMVTRFKPEEIDDRVIYRNSGISAESFFSRICSIHTLKTDPDNREEFEYDTGLVDPLGKPIYKLQPTVYILDSLAMLAPGKLTEEEELTGQMSATAVAKSNTQVYKRMIPKLKEANIILIAINHINQKIEINSFSKTKAQIGYLKTTETLPGGNAPIFLASNIFRIDDSEKLKEKEGLGIRGLIVDITIVKSRTSSSGRSVPLFFNAETGFDKELSMFIFLKSVKEIESKGAYMNFADYPENKFTQKTFKQRLHTDVEFKKMFEEASAKQLKLLIKNNWLFAENEEEFDDDYDCATGILNCL